MQFWRKHLTSKFEYLQYKLVNNANSEILVFQNWKTKQKLFSEENKCLKLEGGRVRQILAK